MTHQPSVASLPAPASLVAPIAPQACSNAQNECVINSVLSAARALSTHPSFSSMYHVSPFSAQLRSITVAIEMTEDELRHLFSQCNALEEIKIEPQVIRCFNLNTISITCCNTLKRVEVYCCGVTNVEQFVRSFSKLEHVHIPKAIVNCKWFKDHSVKGVTALRFVKDSKQYVTNAQVFCEMETAGGGYGTCSRDIWSSCNFGPQNPCSKDIWSGHRIVGSNIGPTGSNIEPSSTKEWWSALFELYKLVCLSIICITVLVAFK